jgi:hypothetical protein
VGDLNLDGEVTISDFIDLASHFNELAGMSWQEGDLNYDGAVTISDFIDQAANFNTSYGVAAVDLAAANGATVPEPGMPLLGALGAVLGLRRRRHGQGARAMRCKPSSAGR